MKNLKTCLLTTILLCATQGLFAQETVNKGDMIIHARIASVAIYGKTLIDVYKRSNSARIIYAKEDSIRFSSVRKDTAYLNASRNLNYSDQDQTAKLGKFFDRYTVYDTTTITINLKKDTAYSKILRLMAETSKEVLETSKIGKRFVLDGFGFGCTIITAMGTKTIIASTPMADSHPIIAKFLEETRERAKPKRKT